MIKKWLECRRAIRTAEKRVKEMLGEDWKDKTGSVGILRALIEEKDPHLKTADEKLYEEYTRIVMSMPFIPRLILVRIGRWKKVKTHIEWTAQKLADWMAEDPNFERRALPVLLKVAKEGEKNFHGAIARKALQKWWRSKNTTKW